MVVCFWPCAVVLHLSLQIFVVAVMIWGSESRFVDCSTFGDVQNDFNIVLASFSGHPQDRHPLPHFKACPTKEPLTGEMSPEKVGRNSDSVGRRHLQLSHEDAKSKKKHCMTCRFWCFCPSDAVEKYWEEGFGEGLLDCCVWLWAGPRSLNSSICKWNQLTELFACGLLAFVRTTNSPLQEGSYNWIPGRAFCGGTAGGRTMS